MLRYLRRLADQDLALDRSMIPLGSCTMKLNATTEMDAGHLARVRRRSTRSRPLDQAAGYRELIDELEAWLVEITGYDAVSLQPNAGSPGRVRRPARHPRATTASRGDADRDVCLIPSSAHGTNAASAVMAGMRVVVVACDDDGNVDVDDLEAKVAEHADRLAALMVTYPSTHGVFEEAHRRDLRRSCTTHGGQVYLDGANLNALVGVAQPGRFGADVQPPQPAQDVLHPPRRRRPGRRPGGGARAPRAVPAQPPAGRRGRPGDRRRRRSRPRRGARPASCRSRGRTSR